MENRPVTLLDLAEIHMLQARSLREKAEAFNTGQIETVRFGLLLNLLSQTHADAAKKLLELVGCRHTTKTKNGE